MPRQSAQMTSRVTDDSADRESRGGLFIPLNSEATLPVLPQSLFDTGKTQRIKGQMTIGHTTSQASGLGPK